MKYLKLLVLALGLFTLNVSAANMNPIKPSDELRIEMVKMIGTNYMDEMKTDELGADVLFTVNNNREIVIISVDSDDHLLEGYLKRKLNYKKVDHKPSKPGGIYLLPVKMVNQF